MRAKTNALKLSNEQNVKNLKSVETILSNHLQTYSDKESTIKNLENKFTSISQKYDEMKIKMENAINTKVNSKTIQYEALVRDLALQVTKLLYENTKLRKYIERELDQVIPALDYSLVVRENFGREDVALYDSIEELVKQNTELKNKTFTFSTSSHTMIPKPSEGAEQEVNNLMKRLSAAEQNNDHLRKARDEWKAQATNLLEQSGSIQKQLRNIQHEYSMLESKAANSDAMVKRLKQELDNNQSVVAPSEHFISS